MASPSLNTYTRPLKREWERVALGFATVLFLAIGAMMVVSFINGLKTNEPGRVNGSSVPPEFSDAAFAYLTDDGQGRVQGRHAFMLPRGIRPQVAVTNPPRKDPVVPPTKDPVITDPPVVIKDPVIPPVIPPKKDPVVVAPPPPPPTIRHYVTYKGFMTLPSSGDARAVLRYERTRGDESRGNDSLLGPGGKLRGFEVESFDEDQIVLKPRNGETIIVLKGERLEINR